MLTWSSSEMFWSLQRTTPTPAGVPLLLSLSGLRQDSQKQCIVQSNKETSEVKFNGMVIDEIECRESCRYTLKLSAPSIEKM